MKISLIESINNAFGSLDKLKGEILKKMERMEFPILLGVDIYHNIVLYNKPNNNITPLLIIREKIKLCQINWSKVNNQYLAILNKSKHIKL